MKILVTGGTGFIGNSLAAELLRLGHEVYCTGAEGENLAAGTCVGYDFDALDWTFGPIEVLFHQAAITDTLVHDRAAMMGVNLDASLRLFHQAMNNGCRKIVYASSCAVYGDCTPPFTEYGPTRPLNVYAESKLQLDALSQNLSIPAVGLRYSNVYGPGEFHKGHSASMVYQLTKQILEGRRPRLFEFGEQSRDFVYVKDVVRANLLAATSDALGVFNVGSGVATSFNDVVAAIGEALGRPLEPEYFPNPHSDYYQNQTCCDLSRSREYLGYEPAWGIREGIKDYLAALC